MGLYILESASKGEFIARYRGEAITQAECARRTGGYRMRVHANLYLDAADEAHFEGRFINDGRRAHRRVNARFAANYKTNTCATTGFTWVRIYATRPIKPGEEILLDYGDSYWDDASALTPPQQQQQQAITPASPTNQPIPPLPPTQQQSLWASPAYISDTPHTRRDTHQQHSTSIHTRILQRSINPHSPAHLASVGRTG